MGARHFEIKYDVPKDSYRIKNLFGSGLFIKIQKKTVIIYLLFLFKYQFYNYIFTFLEFKYLILSY